jgi:large subunit ribosomal protein LP1
MQTRTIYPASIPIQQLRLRESISTTWPEDRHQPARRVRLDTTINHQIERRRVNSMSTTNKPEQAVAFAALILADESIAITPEKLQALLKAAGVEEVEPIWTTLFSKALKDKSIKDILTAITAAPAGRGATYDSKEDGKTTGEDADDEKDGESGIDIDVDSDDGSAFGDLFG